MKSTTATAPMARAALRAGEQTMSSFKAIAEAIESQKEAFEVFQQKADKRADELQDRIETIEM
jgi:hypothetical protein